jgi:hypothetical protein
MSNPATVLYPRVNQVTSTIVTAAMKVRIVGALIRTVFFTHSENRV